MLNPVPGVAPASLVHLSRLNMTGRATEPDRISIEKKQEANVDVESSTSVTDEGLDNGEPAPPKLTPEQEKKLYRKIDLWLMPILTIMYLFSFLDRGMSFLQLGGLVTDCDVLREYW